MKNELDSVKSDLKEQVGSLTTKLGEVYSTQSETLGAVNYQGRQIAGLVEELATLKLEVREKDKTIDKLSRNLNNQITTMKKEIDENTRERKNRNMVINGLPENVNENCVNTAVEFLKRLIPSITSKDIAAAYRLGRKMGDSEFNRSTMVKFKDPQLKIDVMRKKSSLKDSEANKGIFCNDDLPEEKRRLRQKMREIGKFANKHGYENVQVKGDRIWINGKIFTGSDLHLLPKELQPENISVRKIGNGIGFAGESAYLSNYYPCSVRMGDKNFRSAEQAFQYQKCLFCEREDACVHIMQVDDPKVLSEMGNKIFTKKVWEDKKVDMLKCIAISKFDQNPELKEKLKATGSKPLYECTRSRYWGTGWKLDAPNWSKSSNFPGKNVFGNILMEVRDNPKGSGEEPEKIITDKSMCGEDKKPENEGMETEEIPAAEKGTEEQVQQPPLPVMETKDVVPLQGQIDEKIDEEKSDEAKEENGNREGIMDGAENVSSHDSISFSSSTYLSGNTSFTRESVSRADGSLDVNKLMNWSLPKLNTSATVGKKGGHKNCSFNPSAEASAVSTPILIAANRERFRHRKKSTKMEFGSSDEKAAMLTMMNKMLKK